MAAPSLEGETADKVLRQVEFYFSDSNLPRDNFLKTTVGQSEDGMVSLALICSFKRMRSHLNLGEVKPDQVPENTVKAVAEVLRKSSSLRVSEDGDKVGRSTELPKLEEALEQLDNRTIATSPLEYNVKLEEVSSFFAQYGKVNSVRLPRHVADKRLFCGTALVEFSTEEEAEKVLKQSLTYAGTELELKPKKEFDAERTKKLEGLQSGSNLEANSGDGSFPRGLIVAFKLKSMNPGVSTAGSGELAGNDDDVCKAEKGADGSTEQEVLNEVKNDGQSPRENMEEEKEIVEEKNAVEDSNNGETGGKATDDGEKASEDKNAGAKEEKLMATEVVVLREDLKSIFQKFGTVKFVDFRMGAESGYIRFEEAEAAQKARAAAVLAQEGGLVVKNHIATLEPVTGEAEKEYWALIRGKDRHRDHKANRGWWVGKHRGGKHNRSRNNDFSSGRPNKAQKVG